MSGFTRELLRDIHQIVNEATKPLSPEMKQKIEKMADELDDELGNVPRTTIVRALTNMVNQGDSLDDLEGVKQELSQMH